MKRWLLRLAIAFAFVAVGWHVFEFFWDRRLFTHEEEAMKSERVVNVGVREAERLIEENQDLQVVDVRPRSSYRSGHLPGATRVSCRGGSVDEEAAAGLDRGKPILVYCDGGFRSRLSLSAFEKAGFEQIYHLHRGILSWKLRGRPSEKGEDETRAETAESG